MSVPPGASERSTCLLIKHQPLGPLSAGRCCFLPAEFKVRVHLLPESEAPRAASCSGGGAAGKWSFMAEI